MLMLHNQLEIFKVVKTQMSIGVFNEANEANAANEVRQSANEWKCQKTPKTAFLGHLVRFKLKRPFWHEIVILSH